MAATPAAPDPDRPEWIPSPGPWITPRRGQPTPGNIRPRLDRVPTWARWWWRSGIGQRRARQWLWPRGGFDIEIRPPDEWRDSFDRAHGPEYRPAALDEAGPWPRPAVAPDRTAAVVDVDRYGTLAMIVTLVPETGAVPHPRLAVELFSGGPDWRYQGGGVSTRRVSRPDAVTPTSGFMLCGQGWSGSGDRPEIRHALVECGPDLCSVIIERDADLRRFDVPPDGCVFGVVWSAGVDPLIAGFDAAGGPIATLDIPSPAPGRAGARRSAVARLRL